MKRSLNKHLERHDALPESHELAEYELPEWLANEDESLPEWIREEVDDWNRRRRRERTLLAAGVIGFWLGVLYVAARLWGAW